ncbi:MAG TPA: immunoglobulin domain-containing protein [Candidatus Didemnitutus sp.]|nr:immunoglobulin domain-containing protein [Candidatus Didemnitutus sp.]
MRSSRLLSPRGLGAALLLSASGLASGADDAPVYAFRHLAGAPGGGGYRDGVGSAARFDNSHGAIADAFGNIYVTDSGNNVIRKIAPDGTVTTLAGAPLSAGSTDAVGSAARFYFPVGPSFDGSGNLIVADWGNSIIRKVTPAGAVTTLAGTANPTDNPPNATQLDGVGPAAVFWGPCGTAVDTSGSIFVADAGFDRLRKIAPDTTVTTPVLTNPPTWLNSNNGISDLFGANPLGTGWGAQFVYHSALAIDHQNNLLLGNYQSVPASAGYPSFYQVIRVDALGSVSILSAFPTINDLIGVTSDPTDRVVVGVPGALLRLEPDNTVTTIASDSRIDGAGITGAPNGDFIIADYDQILRVSATGVVTKVAGLAAQAGSADGTGASAGFSGPTAIATDNNGNAYVADTNNDTVRKISPDGTVITLAGQAGVPGSADGMGASAQFDHPSGIAVDASGNVYVAEVTNASRVRKISPTGVVTTLGINPVFGFLTVDTAGNLYSVEEVAVLDARLCRLGNDGSVTQLASVDFPLGLTADHSGNVYFTNLGADGTTIKKVDAQGKVTTAAGPTFNFAADIGVTSAYLRPSALAIDGQGNFVVIDPDLDMVLRITPAGDVTAIGGLALYAGSEDGLTKAAHFDHPGGIAVDASGKIYVADTLNNAIRIGEPAGPPVITTQPASETVAPGGTAQFTVTATGAASLTYQWMLNGSAISGATANQLSLTSVSAGNAGNYSVMVTNAVGTATSQAAKLTVSAATTSSSGGSSSGGSGGGAMSGAFVLLLTLVSLLRLRYR